jgi:DNA-binding MarR family transcriptional regulator
VAKSALKQTTQRKTGATASKLRETHASKTRNPAPSLERLIHERLRLGIISALAGNPSLTFNDLKQLLHTTDGNLSVHARKLEEAGYIICEKSFEGRLPKTEYKLSASGRRALENYIGHMEALIHQTRRS